MLGLSSVQKEGNITYVVGFQNKPQQRITKSQKTIIFGSWLGWSLDGYDLVLMLFVISSISQLFFPSKDPTLSLLAIFATYTVTLVMRPVGDCTCSGVFSFYSYFLFSM